MNFITFSVDTTNVFPMTNTTKGGQLVTEYNLRARESVGTPENITYMVGPSYVHSERDFYVQTLSEGAGHSLEISEGRGVINGYFVETLAPMVIDLLDANIKAGENQQPTLNGELIVGLRIMFSGEQTMSGSILSEDENSMYAGIQVVILPKSEFILPSDTIGCTNPYAVTAHIKLAEFKFYNGVISNIVNNYPNKCTMFSANRIGNIDNLISESYVKKTGLDSKKLYTFGGAGDIGGVDTWCDSTDSLMVWDDNPKLIPYVEYVANSKVAFHIGSDGAVNLYVPHKQPHYGMYDGNKKRQMYAPKTYSLPIADYASGSSGTVDKVYTEHIKAVERKIDNLYSLANGKQRMFIEELHDISELPELNSSWKYGDYVLVGKDYTVSPDGNNSYVTTPSTLYTVCPGYVASIFPWGIDLQPGDVNEQGVEFPDGIELLRVTRQYDDSDMVGGKPDMVHPSVFNNYFSIPSNSITGIPHSDYFVVEFYDDKGEVHNAYYIVYSTDILQQYSSPILLTGEIGLAQTDTIGGFLNVDETNTDYGYIIRDEDGHLRLLDYALLRSGTLAYQLGENFTTADGLSTAEIQSQLNEYVNQRVAFANYNHLTNSDKPNVIDITLYLPEESADVPTADRTINIYDIDSRFNTSIYLHIYGSANANTIINISDCGKIRIDENIGGSPTINLLRSNLYYNSEVLDRLSVIQDMRLWYERFETGDPNLIVDYMTVREVDTPISNNNVSLWESDSHNDNHFSYALQSITFSTNGDIIGCSMLVKNNSTSNNALGKSIVCGKFTIPQGAGLSYPITRLVKPLKVTGSFVSAYYTGNTDPVNPWLVQDTSFTAVSQTYDITSEESIDGNISFLVDAYYVSNVSGLTDDIQSIDGWEPNSYHSFIGTSIT